MIFGVADNLHSPAAGSHDVPFGDSVLGVVSAFRVDIRAQHPDKLAHVRGVEEGDRIHVLQSGQNLGAFAGRSARAALTFQSADAGVRIHGYDHFAAEFLCAAQIADVAHVQQIKAAIGQDDFFPGGAPLLHALGEFRLGQDFL